MNEIIKLNTDNMTVSARELHKALEIKYDFKRWVDTNFKHFEEGTDYFGGHIDVSGNQYGGMQTITDYNLTVDMAKHLCLMSQTEKGKQCREYLINLEKAWNTPELVMARGLQAAQKMIEEQGEKIKLLTSDNERMKPKEIFADAVTASDNSILMRDLAKMMKQNGIPMGEKRLYKWMREHGYIVKHSTLPTQKAMELGLFEIVERTVQRADMAPLVKTTTKVTGKGQQYFINKFLGEAYEQQTLI